MYKYTICCLLIAGLSLNSASSHEKILHKNEVHHHLFKHHELNHVAHRIHHHNRHAFHHRNLNQSSSNGFTDLFYSETSQFLSFFNKSSNILSIFDSKSALALLQNGNNNSSGFQIIDTVTKTIYQVNKPVENIESLIKNPPQLQDLIKSGQITNATKLNETLSQLGLNSLNGLDIFSNISKSLNQLHSLNLIGILFKDQNQGSFQDGLEKFSGNVKSILTIFNQIPNNEFLRNNSINLPSILNSSNGVDALIKIVQNLTSNNDKNVSNNLNSFFENIENVLEIVMQLAGSSSRSRLDNIIRIVRSIQGLVSGQSNVEDLIKTLLDVANKTQNLMPDDIKTTIDKLTKLNERSGILSNLAKLLQDIQSNNLNISGVNVCKLWQLIMSGNSKNAAEFVQRIFTQFETFLGPFISQINSTASSIPGIGVIFQNFLGAAQNANKTILQLIPTQISLQDSNEVTSQSAESSASDISSSPQELSTDTLGQKRRAKTQYRHFKHMKSI